MNYKWQFLLHCDFENYSFFCILNSASQTETRDGIEKKMREAQHKISLSQKQIFVTPFHQKFCIMFDILIFYQQI